MNTGWKMINGGKESDITLKHLIEDKIEKLKIEQEKLRDGYEIDYSLTMRYSDEAEWKYQMLENILEQYKKQK